MQRVKEYPETRFGFDVLQDAVSVVREIAGRTDERLNFRQLMVSCPDSSSWTHDSFEEFLADYRTHQGTGAVLSVDGSGSAFALAVQFIEAARRTRITVRSPSRAEIERVFEVFDKQANVSKLPPDPVFEELHQSPSVIIGHGSSLAWRDLENHLRDTLGVKIEAYETGARAGHRIRDILEAMHWKNALGIVVVVGEDEQSSGSWSLRQNAVHEAGLFQGRFGFTRALLLLEDGVEEIPTLQGVQSIRFSKSNIREAFGEVLATLDREFPGELGNVAKA